MGEKVTGDGFWRGSGMSGEMCRRIWNSNSRFENVGECQMLAGV